MGRLQGTPTIAEHPALSKAFSSKNEKCANEVSLGEATEYYFDCFFCHEPFLKIPNDFKRVKHVHYDTIACNNQDCQKNKKIRLSNYRSAHGQSLQMAYPKIAASFIRFVDDDEERHLDFSTIAPESHYYAKWQCENFSYHVYNAKVCNRVNTDQCPFCSPQGHQVHIIDSFYMYLFHHNNQHTIYEYLFNNDCTSFIHPDDLDKSKTLNCSASSGYKGANELRFQCVNCNKYHNSSINRLVRNKNKELAFLPLVCREPDCQTSVKSKALRMTRQIMKGAESVASHPEGWQYCYHQNDLDQSLKNLIPPELVTANCTSQLFPASSQMAHNNFKWRCHRKHITTATPNNRLMNNNECIICSNSSSTSRLECLFFLELKARLIKDNVEVFHRDRRFSVESDILVVGLDKPLCIEIDGFQHKKCYQHDLDKDKTLLQQGVEVFRVRDIRLSDISPPTVFKVITEGAALSSYSDVINECVGAINDLFNASFDSKKAVSLTAAADTYYASLQTPGKGKSIYEMNPKSVDYLIHPNPIEILSKLSPGSECVFNWRSPGGRIIKQATVNNRFNKDGTYKDFIEDLGVQNRKAEKLLRSNPVLCDFLGITDETKITLDMALTVPCSFPFRTDMSLNMSEGFDPTLCCGKTRTTTLKNFLKQIKMKGFFWRFKGCYHPGHIDRKKKNN